MSTAHVGRPRTSSSNTRRNWRPIVPAAPRQPDAAHPAHRDLLAAARRAPSDPELEPAPAHRVRHDPSTSFEDRRPHHRDREPHSHRARVLLPGGRDVQPRRAPAAAIRTLTQRGSDAPRAPHYPPPTASTAFSIQSLCRRMRARTNEHGPPSGLQLMQERLGRAYIHPNSTAGYRVTGVLSQVCKQAGMVAGGTSSLHRRGGLELCGIQYVRLAATTFCSKVRKRRTESFANIGGGWRPRIWLNWKWLSASRTARREPP
jgi:hypothetical protein